jgi:DNA polymerase III epsilon subunit family exonuclease
MSLFSKLINAILEKSGKTDCKNTSMVTPEITAKTTDLITTAEKQENMISGKTTYGSVTLWKTDVDYTNANSIRKRFIAFDVETTGFYCATDRIVEVGAVVFSNGKVIDKFSSLVNPGVKIPQAATNVNHITNEMLAMAPSENEVYPKLIDFLGDALKGETMMCAHNATFDFKFLGHALRRLGFDADILYVDTLTMSRRNLKGLENHKQATVESHFGLYNPESHRAVTDAENCGHILNRLIDVYQELTEEEKQQIEKVKPVAQESELCAFIHKTIADFEGDTSVIRYKRNSSGYVEAYCLNRFLRFRFTKKGNYFIVKSEVELIDKFVTEPCNKTEGGTDFVRVYFSNLLDLEVFAKYIFDSFMEKYTSLIEYSKNGNYAQQQIEKSMRSMYALTDEVAYSLLTPDFERVN